MVRQCDAFSRVRYRILKTQYLLTYSMEGSPSWEANRSRSQEILRILWNPNIHYQTHELLAEKYAPTHIKGDNRKRIFRYKTSNIPRRLIFTNAILD